MVWQHSVGKIVKPFATFCMFIKFIKIFVLISVPQVQCPMYSVICCHCYLSPDCTICTTVTKWISQPDTLACRRQVSQAAGGQPIRPSIFPAGWSVGRSVGCSVDCLVGRLLTLFCCSVSRFVNQSKLRASHYYAYLKMCLWIMNIIWFMVFAIVFSFNSSASCLLHCVEGSKQS